MQGAHAGRRNGKSSDFVCIIKKKRKAGGRLLSWSGEDGKEIQSKKCQVELHRVLQWAKRSKRYGCKHRALTLQCQGCNYWSRVLYVCVADKISIRDHCQARKVCKDFGWKVLCFPDRPLGKKLYCSRLQSLQNYQYRSK